MPDKRSAGISPRDALDYTGAKYSFLPVVSAPREPLTTDKDYVQFTLWRVSIVSPGVPPLTGTEGDLWFLSRFDATGNAIWKLVATGSGASGAVLSLTGDDSTVISPDAGGNINLSGTTVANGTNAKPLFIAGTVGSFLEDIQAQVSAAITGAPADKNDAGLCSFDDTSFAVDANGYVTFIGSTSDFTWNDVTGTTQAMAVANGYSANNAGLVTFTLPATAAFGDIIEVSGFGAGGWKIEQRASQTIHFGNSDTTTGTGGSLASTNRYDTVKLFCAVANTDFVVQRSNGNITVV